MSTNKEQYAVLTWANGVSGEDSLLAWGSVPFQVLDSYQEAYEECERVNRFLMTNGLPASRFVCKGVLRANFGFVPSKE